jgi:hypothetical protein
MEPALQPVATAFRHDPRVFDLGWPILFVLRPDGPCTVPKASVTVLREGTRHPELTISHGGSRNVRIRNYDWKLVEE